MNHDTITTAGAADTILNRFNFRFDGSGQHAVCLAAAADGALRIETWTFAADGTRTRLLPVSARESLATQLVAAHDGRVVALRGGSAPFELALIEPSGAGAHTRPVARLHHPGARLLASPDPATLALVITTDGVRGTTVRRLTRDVRLETDLEHDGVLGGGLWLDEHGHRLAFSHAVKGRATTVAADLTRGTVDPLLPTGAQPLLIGPASQLALIAAAKDGRVRLGVAELSGARPPRFPSVLDAPVIGNVVPLAVDPSGQRFALVAEQGARSALLVFDASADTVTRFPLSDGVIKGAGSWTVSGLRFLFAAPDRPTGVATLTDSGSLTLPEPMPRPCSDRRPWAHAHLETLDGPAGPIEAVVYGGPGWRDSPRLMVALHGGPASAWRFDFSPFFQHLADIGIAVVAPNQRGSTGYGREHQEALHHAWGVPDLEDVRHLGRALGEHRQRIGAAPPALYGISYGAFLALLAAGADPHLWSRCAVAAPFLSGPRLDSQASPPVRAMLKRLGGLTETDDALGPRDALRFAGRIQSPLLVLHGTQDQIVPVAHARALRRHLLRAGRREGEGFSYVEVPEGRHSLLDEAAGTEVAATIGQFMVGTTPFTATRRGL
ncbi:alpha/beta fold hydrolase [Streptomyces sp. E11-3]|uniref:S9 family peptidase n=1 Tax=Streptomyces sp. E11-3 TaxID=3110112 RepID=UPI003980911F